jgi:hypothetical protein
MRGEDPIEAVAMECYGSFVDTKTKPPWLGLGSVIVVAANATMIYLMSILFGLPLGWILGLLLSSMVAAVWMVIRILKDPYSTDKVFDEYFYQDRPDIRRNGKE